MQRSASAAVQNQRPHQRRARDRKLRGADIIVQTLAQAGVRTVFGIPGGTISPVNDALLDFPEISVFVTRHESEAVFAACGYAISSKGVGVAFVTSGPGATNALTGLASAYCDGVPMILLVGEVPRGLQGRGALQDGSSHHLNIVGIAKNIAKGAWEATDVKILPVLMRRALALAQAGRPGPVVLTLPLDVLMAETFAPTVTHELETSYKLSPTSLERTEESIAKSKRPVIFAGAGARHGDGPAALLAFAERYQIPVITTPKGKGVFPETHPLSLGIFGIGGHLSAQNYLQSNVDLVIALGTSFGDLSTDGWSQHLYPTRVLVHVDIDGAAIGRSYAPDVGVIAPIHVFLRAMLERHAIVRPSHGPYGVVRHSDPEQTTDGSENRISPARALWELQKVLPADTIYTIDSGEHFLFAAHYLRLSYSDTFMCMTGLGAMGSSVGMAIGAQLAKPSRRVAVIMGDGGFSMIATEIADAVKAKLPLVICVMNDGCLRMCELGHLNVYGRTPNYGIPEIDVSCLAESLGAQAMRVAHTGDILARSSDFQKRSRPMVLDIQVDRSFTLPKKDRIGALGERRDKAA